MLKTDLMEIKKTIKKDNVTISRIATCYVYGNEHKMVRKDMSFLNLPEEEFYKYLEIIKKVMDCKAGDTLQSIPLRNDESKKVLDTFRQTELKSPEIIDAFCQQIKDSFEFLGNYLIIFYYSAYDLPARGTDKLKQHESDEVYNAIYCAICPVELSEPGLSFFEEEGEIHNRIRDWVVSDPEVGFLYPDFHNRIIDDSRIAYGIRNKKDQHDELVDALFGARSLPTSAAQAQTLTMALSESLADEDLEKVTEVTKNIVAKVKAIEERIKADEEIIKTEDGESEEPVIKIIREPVATISDIKQVIVDSGISEEKAENFVQTYKELSPEVSDQVRVDKAYKKGKIKAENIDISIPSDKMNDVAIKEIDGKRCIVIELSDNTSEISVNGIICN